MRYACEPCLIKIIHTLFEAVTPEEKKLEDETMPGSLKKLLSRIHGGQKGFTLIEMIVVVGIIAVLAAVIVPNIGKFIGSGELSPTSASSSAPANREPRTRSTSPCRPP